MNDFMSTVLVPLYFLLATFGLSVLAWWFKKQPKKTHQYFGWGLMGYSLALLAWTAVVIVKPADPRPLILVGVVPFILASVAYAQAAAQKWPKLSQLTLGLTVVLIAAVFMARTFLFPSDPHFSDQGLLYFGLQPVPVALYVALLSVSFLPGIRAAVADIKQDQVRAVMGVGLMILFLNAVIQVVTKDDTLSVVNGVVTSLTLLFLWVKALGWKAKA